MRYAQLVLGPAGSGKSTYCHSLESYCIDNKRSIQIFNLDPAAEHFVYTPTADVRELVQLEDVMEADDLSFGPNGGLVFCMEYLMGAEGLAWLKEQIGDYDDDYLVFDCPGQIELYTHMDIFKRFAKKLQEWNFMVCAVFLLDSHYMVDSAKFLSGSLTALSTMVKLEIAQVNVLSKMDLLSKEARKQLQNFLEPEVFALCSDDYWKSKFNNRYRKLTQALGQVLEEFSLVRFQPLNINKEESMKELLLHIDITIQYGEDADVKTVDFEFPDNESEHDDEQ